MNFELSEEQSLLRESLSRSLSAPAASGHWSALAELGVLAAPFAEADGGLGMGPAETLVIGEALGKALSSEPYLSAIVLAGTALRLAPKSEVRSALIGGLVSGAQRLGFAHEEPGRRDPLQPRSTTARKTGSGYIIEGRKSSVLGGDGADHIIVSAMMDGAPALFAVASHAPGLERRRYCSFDGRGMADLTVNALHLEPTALLAADASQIIPQILEHGAAFLAAEAVGVMDMVLEATTEHLKTRRQFGQPLAKFQALQHKAAEMLVAQEQARSMAIYAAMMVEEGDDAARRDAFAAIAYVVADAARLVGQHAVQLHGGIGVTEEHAVGRAFKRLTMIDLMLSELARGATA